MSRDLSTQSKIHLAKTVLAKMNIKKAGKSFSLQKEVYLKLKVFNDFPDYWWAFIAYSSAHDFSLVTISVPTICHKIR